MIATPSQGAQLGATDLRMDTDLYELFFIQGGDKSALVDPSDERWIDD